mmetsp:Transcript_21780/g.35210  ORF Transcript_21780/g.35210 Transcript_21780/m.35210 type:complete len:212 (-) Transcript_21780:348-983(-)
MIFTLEASGAAGWKMTPAVMIFCSVSQTHTSSDFLSDERSSGVFFSLTRCSTLALNSLVPDLVLMGFTSTIVEEEEPLDSSSLLPAITSQGDGPALVSLESNKTLSPTVKDSCSSMSTCSSPSSNASAASAEVEVAVPLSPCCCDPAPPPCCCFSSSLAFSSSPSPFFIVSLAVFAAAAACWAPPSTAICEACSSGMFIRMYARSSFSSLP